MMKKKILIDTKTILPLYIQGFISGIGRSTYELLNALQKKKDLPFEVILFSQSTKGVSPKKDFLFKNLHFYMPDRPFFRKVTNFLKMKRWFVRYDLLHMPNNTAEVPECIEKTIYTIHDLAVCKFPEMWPNTDGVFFDRLKDDIARCKSIVTCSEATKRDIVKFAGVSPDKVEVIYWGVNQEKFKPSMDKGYLQNHRIIPAYFFSSSCNHPRKNLPVLLAAYRKYRENNGERQLVLLNPLKEFLDDYMDLIENNNIIVCRNVSDENLIELYSHAHCSFIISSYEGFGFPILESLSCETPVVAANNSSLPEAGGDVALYLKDTTVDSVYEMMKYIDVKDKIQLLDMSACRKHLAKFTWDVCADKYVSYYKTLLKL